MRECEGWYQNDITTFEGCKIDTATSQFGLSQIIKEPTHILSNSAPCSDAIFTSQPNLLMHSGVHPLLHPNCHHQIVFNWKKSLSRLDANKQVSVFNETSLKISFLTKQSLVMTKILPG